MILAIGLSIQSSNFSQIGDAYEFDNKYWNLIAMDWNDINDTWEFE